MYDYIVVGAGLFGVTFARVMTDAGKNCLIVDKNNYVGGNCADEWKDGILVNRHGGHIFHTNSREIWNFVNRFGRFWPYRHQVKASYFGKIFSLPINLHTFYELFGVTTPQQAQELLNNIRDFDIRLDDSVKSWVINNYGAQIYQVFVHHYTKKQWGIPCDELPSSLIRRLPFRMTWNNDYFSDCYQGVPVRGYSNLVSAIVENIPYNLLVDFSEWRKELEGMAKKIVYSGPIDELFEYRYGELEYRSLRWEHETHNVKDYQGIATINYTDDHPFTRVLEHRHFMLYQPKHNRTIVSWEYPERWRKGMERYYPINNEKNNHIASMYKELAEREGYIVGGRLGSYQYLNMDQAIAQAMSLAKKELNA